MERVLLTEEVRKQIVDEITEGVIRSLRKEFLKEHFAISRKHFILNSYHLLSPLMEHWCLIRFVRLTETDCGTIPHWKHEVSIFMRDIAYQNLDGGNKYKTRFKALKEAWNMGDFDKDPNAVYRSVISKFEDEKVGFNLAITGAIKADILRNDDIAVFFLNFVKEHYPTAIKDRYNIEVSDDSNETLVRIAESLHFYLGNKEVDIDKTALYLLQEYRSDYLGKMTLDRI